MSLNVNLLVNPCPEIEEKDFMIRTLMVGGLSISLSTLSIDENSNNLD